MTNTGLANASAPWVDGWEPAVLPHDPLTHETGPIGLAQRAGRPLGTVDQTNDSPRPAQLDLTYYTASPDGSAIRPMSGLHAAIPQQSLAPHQGEQRPPWDQVVTMPRYAPQWGWDHGARLTSSPDVFGL